MRSGFTTIGKKCEWETVIKGSRFIACASPCSSEDDLDSFLSEVKAKYPNATHYCYAAVFESNERFSDNGEPSGTAGRLILQVIRGSDIDDLAIVVVRYFGGTLLGTGGLVQAYSGSASEVVKTVERIEMVLCTGYTFTLTYSEYNVFLSDLSKMCSIRDQQFAEAVKLTADVRSGEDDLFLKKLADLTKGKAVAVQCGNGYCPSW